MSHDFFSSFSVLPDPRVDRTKRYPLNEIIFLIITATVSGCDGWKSIKDFGDAKLDWLRRFLPYEAGIPVDDTIARVMRKLDNKAFQSCFINWVNGISDKTEGRIVAIDGKTARRSHDKANGKSPIHMVNAWCSENGLVLGQEKTAEKSNEITAIPELLEVLELKGCIVTIDAMGCQTAIADKIRARQADYVLALKGNHGDLHTDVKDFFHLAGKTDFKGYSCGFYEENNKGHGRIETRQCWAIKPNKALFFGMEKWSGLNSIVMVKSKREILSSQTVTEETRYYISSLKPDAQKILKSVRKHWEVENALHWVLDVTFREDESRIRIGQAPENFAVIRQIALNIIKKDSTIKASVKRKRFMAALKDDYRETIIKQAI